MTLRLASHSRFHRITHRARVGLPVLWLTWLVTSAYAAPAPAPGGHHRLTVGGNNRLGYPNLHQSAGIPLHGATPVELAVRAEPNPFRGALRFSITLRPGETARVRIFNLNGALVRQLWPSAATATWDGRDAAGHRLAPGVYLYRVDAGGRSARGKVAFIR